MVIAIYSPKGRYDQLYLSNFATIKIKRRDCPGGRRRRLPCSSASKTTACASGSIRERLAELNLTAADVVNALREQNRQVAAGHIGQQPTADGQRFEFTITTLGRLSNPAEFDDIVLRTDGNGRQGPHQGHRPGADRSRGTNPTGGEEPRLHQPGRRPAQRQPRRLRPARRQRHRHRPERARQDGRAEEEFPGRHRLRGLPGHDAVHPGVDQRGHPHPDRGHRPGRRRGADLPAKLALGPDPAGGRAGRRSSAPSRSWRPSASP